MQEKLKYTSCPFCGSIQIKYKSIENLKEYDEYSKEEIKTFFKEEKKYGRTGICSDCGMEFREFKDPRVDKKIQSMIKISIEEYIDTITKEISKIPELGQVPFAAILLENKINAAKNKKFYFKEIMEEEILQIQEMTSLTNQLINSNSKK